MKFRSSKLVLLALVLLIGAALARLSANRILNQHRWVVLDQPVRVEAGAAFSYPFTVDIAAPYEVELGCRRAISNTVLDQTLDKDLIADYEVSSKGERLVTGDTSSWKGSSGGGGTTSRLLGNFAAEPGRPYLLRIHFARTLPVLAATQPRLKVSVHPRVYKPFYFRAALLAHLALALAILGAGCLLWALFSRLLSRRATTG